MPKSIAKQMDFLSRRFHGRRLSVSYATINATEAIFNKYFTF
jgi:hypothetical protein